MPYYIALIHKDVDSCYGVSFPDWPGVVTAGDTFDEVMQWAVEVLAFAVEDRENTDVSGKFPSRAQSTNCGLIRNFVTMLLTL
jgi:antitoxin HicB